MRTNGKKGEDRPATTPETTAEESKDLAPKDGEEVRGGWQWGLGRGITDRSQEEAKK